MPELMLSAPPAPFKKCSCGRVHTKAEWDALPYVGPMYTPADEFGPEETLELRNCECNSTLAVLVETKKAA